MFYSLYTRDRQYHISHLFLLRQLALLCIGFTVYSTLTISDTLAEMLQDSLAFANFEFLGYWQVRNLTLSIAICRDFQLVNYRPNYFIINFLLSFLNYNFLTYFMQ